MFLATGRSLKPIRKFSPGGFPREYTRNTSSLVHYHSPLATPQKGTFEIDIALRLNRRGNSTLDQKRLVKAISGAILCMR